MTKPEELSSVQFSALKPVVESTFSSHRYGSINDCCAMIIHCPVHKRFAMCNSLHLGRHFRWFPFLYPSPKISWEKARMSLLRKVLGEKASEKMLRNAFCLNMFRVQLPRTLRFITRMLYYVQLDSQQIDMCPGGQDSSSTPANIQWFDVDEAIDGLINDLWGPEVGHYLSFAIRKVPVLNLVEEIGLREVFKVLPLCSKPKTRDEDMIIENKVTTKDVERLYDEYIEHCFPSYFMNQVMFDCFMAKHGLETDQTRLNSYWKAFRYLEKPYLSFGELFLGLVAIDKETPHCETRLKFIFRYYDFDQDGSLDIVEFSRLIKDMHPDMSKEEISKKTTSILNDIKYKLLKPNPRKQSDQRQTAGRTTIHRARIGFVVFFNAVKARILVGTSRLSRAKVTVFSSISRALVCRRIQQIHEKKYCFRSVITTNSPPEKCLSCVARNQKLSYRLATTVLTLTKTRQLKRATALEGVPEQASSQDNQANAPVDWTKHSTEVQFNHKSLANVYLKMIGDFGRSNIKGNGLNRKGLFSMIPTSKHKQFEVDIENICKNVSNILEKEPHILDLKSPIFVIGDIHGNIEDLLTLEQSLWPSKPSFNCNNYLFLGDYVDRGHWGFECAIYLFCIKLLAPHKFNLLRGNHEIRCIQRSFSYEEELEFKYGSRVGARFFELTNHVFDRMSCGAIVDNSIFCAHGGIPFTGLSEPIRESTSKFPKPISSPDSLEKKTIWEILWSDPVERRILRGEYELLTDMDRKASNNEQVTSDDAFISKQYQMGFLPNNKRNTAFLFSDIAFGTFCDVNSLSYMIRAHEVPMEGYRLNFAGHCITTFSCSHYCGLDNECSVVYLQDNRIRIVRMHTADNNSATGND